MFSSLMWYTDRPEEKKTLYAPYKGSMLEYSVVSGRAVLSRVISSNTSHYLDSRLYPGADISDIVLENSFL